MKILMVTSGMDVGGAETHIYELCLALAKRGISVQIASAGGTAAEALERRGFSHTTLPLDRKTPTALLTAKKGLERLIRSEKFDIVHAHARIPAFLCGLLRGRLGFRFVTTDHARFRLAPLFRRLTDWGEFTFAVSEDLREYLMENFRLPPSRIAVTANGIDTERFAPTVARAHNAERAVILHVSRLEKDVCLCVRALMGAIKLLGGTVTLVIAGDGSYADTLREEAAEINERLGHEAIILLGAVTDVENHIAAADIVISPSRAAMEAMACAKPTVISGSQGYGGIFRKEIEDKAVRSNFCFRGSPLPTPEMLARDIQAILGMTEKEKTSLGSYARDFICEHYSVDIMAQTHLDGYRALLSEPGYDILICGYYGYGNAGDETLLSVTVSELRRIKPDLRLCALSAAPAQTEKALGIDAVARFDLDRVAKAMAHTRMLLFGGGNLLQDKTSTHSLIYYTHILHMARKRGLKISVFANGIGPLSEEKNRERMKAALLTADEISLRDPDSFALVRALAPEKPVRLTFDPAILAEKSAFPIPKGDYFIVAPKRSSPKVTEFLTVFIRELAGRSGMTPILVSMFEREDGGFVRDLAARTSVVISRPQNAGEYLTLFSSARLVFSSRLHGLVYATAAVCPMMGYSDDPKIFSYLDYIGFGADSRLNCGIRRDLAPEAALARALEILCAEKEIRRELLHALDGRRALAREDIAHAVRLLNERNV